LLAAIYAICFGHRSNESVTEPKEAETILQTEEPTDNQETTESTAGPVEVLQPDMVIETPFCTLAYPGKWNDQVRIEQVDSGMVYAVNFYGTSQGKETALFSVLFGQRTENAALVGAMVQNGIAMDVSIEMAVLEDSVAEEILAMQADVDYLLGKLTENMFFQAPEMEDDVLIPDLSDAVVETPYGTLYYPGEWKDVVTWEVSSEYGICTVSFAESFTGKNAELFILSFGNPDDTGFQMGTLHHDGLEIPVYLTLCDFPQGNDWDDSQTSLFLTLQEQVYDMLEKFAEEAAYTSIF